LDARTNFQTVGADALGIAVDEMIRLQGEFVAWWKRHVSGRHGLNRHNVENADRGSLTKADAEAATCISQQQVSRWKARLADPAYAAPFRLAATYAARLAMLTYHLPPWRRAVIAPLAAHCLMRSQLNPSATAVAALIAVMPLGGAAPFTRIASRSSRTSSAISTTRIASASTACDRRATSAAIGGAVGGSVARDRRLMAPAFLYAAQKQQILPSN
jgi:hypothetical protein